MEPLTVLAALTLGTIGVARATRLITSDSYPPAEWLRLRWLTWTAQTPRREPWGVLATCPFCFAPYAAAVNLVWAVWSGAPFVETAYQAVEPWTWTSAWWVVNVWAAVSYAAAMLVVRDEPPAED